MITIFNRRQLAVTYALEEKIHICRVLAEQNIAKRFSIVVYNRH